MLLTLLESPSAAEADRIMTICNACRYCEGHCAVFPAMTLRLEFTPADVGYFANLCHGCGSCYHHCQYADPHEFAVNVPRSMAALRSEAHTSELQSLMRISYAVFCSQKKKNNYN